MKLFTLTAAALFLGISSVALAQGAGGGSGAGSASEGASNGATSGTGGTGASGGTSTPSGAGGPKTGASSDSAGVSSGTAGGQVAPSAKGDTPAATNDEIKKSNGATDLKAYQENNQMTPQGPSGPLNTTSGGAPAASPQGETPPGMQSAPEGSSKTVGDPTNK